MIVVISRCQCTAFFIAETLTNKKQIEKENNIWHFLIKQ
jgi:hypothetical protein